MSRIARRPLLAAPFLLGLRPARAATALTLAAGYPETNFQTRTLRWFAEQVRTRTDGAVEITVHSNGSLLALPAIKRAVQAGQVQMGDILLGNHGNEDAILEADSVPFLASGFAEARKLYAAQKPMLEARFARQGATLLYSVAWPGNGVFSRRELKSLAEMAGMKFRAYNALTARLAEYWKAQPVNVQVPELAQAFTTGVAEVMVAASAVVVNTRGWDFGRYFYDLRAFNPRNAVLMNSRAFRALPPAQQEVLRSAAAEAEARGWQASAEEEEANLGIMAENGMTVVQPDATMQAEMREAGQAMVTAWLERAGADGEALRRAMGR
jgi:TRAP-type C4-dicarboxylate transport system substrate-binding protein